MIFSMWDTATELLVKAGDVRSVLVGICVGVRFSVLEALVSIKTAQRSTTWWNRKKWSIKALSSVKLIRKWVKRGNVRPSVMNWQACIMVVKEMLVRERTI